MDPSQEEQALHYWAVSWVIVQIFLMSIMSNMFVYI